MQKQSLGGFYNRLQTKNSPLPLNGQFELTYRCNLNCIHCYCRGLQVTANPSQVKGQGQPDKELTTQEWEKILDEIRKAGCLWLTLTGGDPLIREDFRELYSFAKRKGFIITLFTNGQALTKEIINYLVKSPPFSIEITLNGITPKTYESITQVKGSFSKVMQTIKTLAQTPLRLILKANCLKQNRHQIGRIKDFSEELLGRPSAKKYRFKYDPFIRPRLNGDKTPCNYRLSFRQLLAVRRQDADLWREYEEGLNCKFPGLKRERNFLYQCNAWQNSFFIDPFGRLKFCNLSEKFSIDLKTTSFKEGFYKVFPQLLNERFETDSKCQDCRLRPVCYYCPARAYLETGNEEGPVPHYCQLAKGLAQEMSGVRNRS